MITRTDECHRVAAVCYKSAMVACNAGRPRNAWLWGAGALSLASACVVDTPSSPPPANGAGLPPSFILMVGDGMGFEHLRAAGGFASGVFGALAMEQLPYGGRVITSSLSGVTDSAAAATTMGSGVKTYNGRVGEDREGDRVVSLIELARARGLGTGIVTTAALNDATPAGFSAHQPSRSDLLAIADEQALASGVDVLLGGGAQYYLPAGDDSLRADGGLVQPLTDAGYLIVRTALELEAAAPARRLVGLFAPNHMTYGVDRAADTTEPTLEAMTAAALQALSLSGRGFFLLVEGGLIDKASHGSDLERAVIETLAFDRTVALVAEFCAQQPNATLVVTADHETGGLEVLSSQGAGVLPSVSWRWGSHTNTRVPVFALGPGAALFDGASVDNRFVAALGVSILESAALVVPPWQLLADGELGELRYLAATAAAASTFGAGFNELDALYVDADRYGLAAGVSGLFEWGKNAVVILIDRDFGAGTGPAALAGALFDHDGQIDNLLANLRLLDSGIPGFGIDAALVVFGGMETHLEELRDDVGLRGVAPPVGDPSNFTWLPAVVNFGDEVRVANGPAAPRARRGLEIAVPWSSLYAQGDAVPPGAVVGIAVLLVNDDGTYLANQTLPSFVAGTPGPGAAAVALPGIVVVPVDQNGDGRADDPGAPQELRR
ncbi:MAG: alkaline phosphatase [Deltaproteobacteria bacterium]|nr:alkaline phosphatase [Deltaproteobacteria bacterium]